jgi:hypothetical protein
MKLLLSIKRWVEAVEKFKFDKSNTSKDHVWISESQNTKMKYELGGGPRLVGGTTFAQQTALDRNQVKLLSQAAIKSMEETRKILTKWRRQGHFLADIYIHGIAESARDIGAMWLSDELDFVNISIAFSRLHSALHELSKEFLAEGNAEPNGRHLLLMTEPGSHHGLGIFMLSEFFRHAGWRVTLAVPNDITDFKRVFLSDWFDAVVLSISTDRHIDSVAKAVIELRPATVNQELNIYIGGPMALLSPDLLILPGTELLQTEAPQTVETVTQAIHSSRQCCPAPRSQSMANKN